MSTSYHQQWMTEEGIQRFELVDNPDDQYALLAARMSQGHARLCLIVQHPGRDPHGDERPDAFRFVQDRGRTTVSNTGVEFGALQFPHFDDEFVDDVDSAAAAGQRFLARLGLPSLILVDHF